MKTTKFPSVVVNSRIFGRVIMEKRSMEVYEQLQPGCVEFQE